ncbi:hypothetical protein [Nocardia sp. BMG51109]|uniref:hypothetical protein n=1 Tax=Nocardia sp. BMG51109 TaxID=1056816 RepID=UPI0004B88B53|nr:hypothetical protein [Nocardia sp. BMG51109]
MPDDRLATSSDRPTYTIYYGSSPDHPLAFTVPPVEATPDQPLPECGPFLRVCGGAEEPTTVMLRAARELAGIWRHVFEQRPMGVVAYLEIRPVRAPAARLEARRAGRSRTELVH